MSESEKQEVEKYKKVAGYVDPEKIDVSDYNDIDARLNVNRRGASKMLPVPVEKKGYYTEDGRFVRFSPRRKLTKTQRAVIRKIAMGMPKGKAWISEHPNCHYMPNAYACVRKLFKRKDAVLYYNEIVAEQEDFIDDENMITTNGISLILKESLADAQAMIDMGKNLGTKEGAEMVLKGIELKRKIAVDYSKTLGRGTYKKETRKIEEEKEEKEDRDIINITPVEEKLNELINGNSN